MRCLLLAEQLQLAWKYPHLIAVFAKKSRKVSPTVLLQLRLFPQNNTIKYLKKNLFLYKSYIAITLQYKNLSNEFLVFLQARIIYNLKIAVTTQ